MAMIKSALREMNIMKVRTMIGFVLLWIDAY